MSKSVKKTETVQVAQPTVTSVAAVTQQAQAATKQTGKGKKETTTTTTTAVTTTPVVTVAGTTTVVAATTNTVGQVAEQDGGAETTENSLNTQYNELQTQVTNAQELLTTLKNNLKRFHKVAERQIAKLSKNKRQHNQNRTPTGFGKARGVPTAIITLLGLETGAEMTRPDVTKKLYEYIDSNKLRSEEDKRIIRVNDGLTTAFKLTKDQVKAINSSKSEKDANGLNFYNIQKYVAKLYQETDEATATATAATKKVIVEDTVEVKTKKANK